ncbi:hypothetical protein [Dyadobacter fermentans]|uniref:YARHG domain-containing protein n=1 Tax=Dyadobacter fermentans (strain ATCC 700827 / DSM 18053 / CIP 107007 / KCTC 52180 / NS114) TaxID=471854 RepID=C6W227_DYAFD|nr:hypothetical protein [Dyadobacter fermentans]ACT95602.1 hypothetical protein Dfer_4400 [Dyadobacter fermentans DSM 18053]
MRIFTIALLLHALFSGNLHAQGPLTDASSAREVAAYPVSLYKTATSISQNLYNGRQYFVYDARMEEHQFFEQRRWLNGMVIYDGQQFDSIPMLYDIFRDEVVIRHFNGDHVLLQTVKIDSFVVDNHHFARLESGREINPQMRTGFYDIIYGGKSRTLVRRTKTRQEKIVDKKVIAYYPEKNFYYVFKDGRYHSVNSKKSALELFADHKREMRRVLRENKLKYRKNREMAIVKMVETYDNLAK